MEFDQAFWEETYRKQAPLLLGVCRRYVTDIKTAEDLMHEVFLTAINKIGSYHGRGSIEAWLRKIAINTSLMYLRQKKHFLAIESDLHDETFNDESKETFESSVRSIIEDAFFSDNELVAVIDQLPEHHKMVFNLYVIDDFSHAMIAKELNISPGTSKSHLARARKKIQSLLYQKAIELPREKEKEKHKQRALWWILPFGGNYIDRKFKFRMQHFSLEPANSFPILNFEGFQKTTTVKLSTLKGLFHNNKAVLITTTLGIIFIIGLIFHQFNNIQENRNTIEGNTLPKTDTLQKDTLVILPIEPKPIDLHNNNKGTMIKVKKVIYKHEPVYFKDTTHEK